MQLFRRWNLTSHFVDHVVLGACVFACGSMPLPARQAIVQHRALPGE